MATTRQAAEGRIGAIIGPTLAWACRSAWLLDQVVIHVIQVLLGAGTPWFRGAPLDLKKLAVTSTGDVTNFLFAPV